MPILNYTTTVSAEKSANEVMSKLVKAGAQKIALSYSDQQPVGINFLVETQYGPRGYTLPADAIGVYKALCNSRAERRYKTKEQAQRVAWRILKDWVEAQLAIIEAGLTTLDTVMLPYMLDRGGRSVADLYHERQGQLAIEAPA